MLFVPTAGKVVNLESAPAAAVKLDDIKAALEQHKPAALFLCQVGCLESWTCVICKQHQHNHARGILLRVLLP